MIYLDSCVVIYAVEGADDRGDAVRRRLRRAPDEVFAVTPLVRMECLVGALRRADFELEARYDEVLDLLHPLDLDAAVYERATSLRATTGLRTPDALHLAAAQIHGCTELWTNDSRLETASHGLAVNVLAGVG